MTIDSLLESIDTIADKINNSSIISQAIKAYSVDIESSYVSDEEKQKLISQFKAQLALGTIAQIFDFIKQVPELEARVKLIDAQTESEKKRASDIVQTTLLRVSQISTESQRQKDLQAAVNVKNSQAQLIYFQALFEETRAGLAIKSNADNMQLRKADYKVREMQAFMTNESYTITTSQISDSKITIDNIQIASLNLPTKITFTPLVIT